MIQFYHSLISERNLSSWDAFWLLVALAFAGKSPKSQEVCPVWRNLWSPQRLGGAPSHPPALSMRTSWIPLLPAQKNVHCFPSVFPRQALSLLLVDVLSYISMSPSAQHLNKGMERFKNSLKCFGLRKGLERQANVTEECREGWSQKQAAESKSGCFTDNTEAILAPQCLLW